jgi:hypothetical protein
LLFEKVVFLKSLFVYSNTHRQAVNAAHSISF